MFSACLCKNCKHNFYPKNYNFCTMLIFSAMFLVTGHAVSRLSVNKEVNFIDYIYIHLRKFQGFCRKPLSKTSFKHKLCFLYAVSGIKRKQFYTWVCARECGLFDHVNICRFLKNVHDCGKEWMIKVEEKCGENRLLMEPHVYAGYSTPPTQCM